MPNEKGTIVHSLQKKFQNVFGFTLPLFHGRGLLNCMLVLSILHGRVLIDLLTPLISCESDNLGLLPYRRRIVTVSEYPAV